VNKTSVGLLMFLVVGCAGCGTPSKPTPVSTAVVWSGTLTDSFNGAGSLRLELEGAGTGKLGMWTARFPNQADIKTGSVIGMIDGTAGTLNLSISPPRPCPGIPFSELNGTFFLEVTVTSKTMSGRSSYAACEKSIEGRVELIRQ
jgi:hypothetical protein